MHSALGIATTPYTERCDAIKNKMGLDFHLGQGGIDNLGEYLGQIDMEEFNWLQKNGFLLAIKTGDISDPIESPLYFDDVILKHAQILVLKIKFDSRKREVMKTPGFKSSAVDKMEKILNRLIDEKKGLSTCVD